MSALDRRYGKSCDIVVIVFVVVVVAAQQPLIVVIVVVVVVVVGGGVGCSAKNNIQPRHPPGTFMECWTGDARLARFCD